LIFRGPTEGPGGTVLFPCPELRTAACFGSAGYSPHGHHLARRLDYRLDGSSARHAQEDSVFDYDLPAPSPRARELQDRMVTFMREGILPAEAEYLAHRRAAGPTSR
jgi:hypothetical protein